MANITTEKQAKELQDRFNYRGDPKTLAELIHLGDFGATDPTYAGQVDYAISEQLQVFYSCSDTLANSFARQKRSDLEYVKYGESRTTPEDHQKAIDSISAQLREEHAKLDDLKDLYTGWTRFYLVLNAGGHVHNTRSCSSCFPTTRFGWLPLLSNTPGDDLIVHFGTSVCTVCFPGAPVDPRWADAVKADAELADDICPGSGKYPGPPADGRYGRRYSKCEVCGDSVAKTSRGALRKHKTEAARNAAKDASREARNKANREANAARKAYRAKRKAEGR